MSKDVPDGGVSFSETRLSSSERDARSATWQAEVVARCLEGDERAFALIADQYGNLLLRTAYLLVRDQDAAQDIVQEALILAWKNMHTLREPHFLRAWLLKIVVNQSTSFRRQLARRASFFREQAAQQSIDIAVEEADTHRGRIEDTLDVVQAIGKLPVNQRTVLILFYYHRMTMPEIARVLDTTENTLRKRLQSALEKIRRFIQIDSLSIDERSTLIDPLNSHIQIHGDRA